MPNNQDAMLTGLKVLDCGENVSAPYATKLMADLGAEVIKVEPPVAGEIARARGPYPRDHENDREQSGLFLALNTNKRGVTIDLVHPEGRALLDRLVKQADVLVHNYSPIKGQGPWSGLRTVVPGQRRADRNANHDLRRHRSQERVDGA